MSGEILLTREHMDLFARASGDWNPLHCDEAYARRTPFGGRVAHGMLGALAALQPALDAMPLPLASVDLRFLRPLRPDTPFRISIAGDRPGQLQLALHRGGAPFLTASLEHRQAQAPFAAAAPSPAVAPRAEARPCEAAELPGLAVQGDWAPDPDGLMALCARLGLRRAHLAPLQLSALLWCSYLVGMELPGRQALFRGVRLDFAPHALPPAAALQFAAETERWDAESGRVEARATLAHGGQAFATAALSAYLRPEPLRPDLEAFAAALPASDRLRGRVALVTGATGGLGAHIAIALARHGADVAVHGRDLGRAEALAGRLRGLGVAALAVEGDLLEPGVWERVARALRRGLGRLDIAVHNASAPPIPLGVEEASPADLEALLHAPLSAMIRGHQALLPLLRRQRGWVVYVSSEATRAPPAGWWSYVTLKAAGEALLRAMAVDHPELRFLDVRPPRLQTDMTALHRLAVGEEPGRIATALLAGLLQEPPAGQPLVLDRFDEEER